MSAAAGIGQRAAFDFIRYANVWEDADVLCEALAPVAAGGRLLSIASAGDNALALLTLDPREIVAVDLSLTQLACLELRIVAFQELEWEQLLQFLGVLPSNERLITYRQLRPKLSPSAQNFWDSHASTVREGIIHGGKFERYFRIFRRWVLPLVHSRPTIAALGAAKTLEEQRSFYAEHWDSVRWRAMFSLFFSRFVLGRLGRDAEFFAHVEGTVGSRILARTRYALTELPVSSNPYFHYIMTQNFPLSALPMYLRREHFACIRSRVDRIELHHGTVESASGSFDAFNLSDIFEYMDTDQHRHCYSQMVDRARSGARLVYWNLLTPRQRPEEERRSKALPKLAADLHARDRAWFYAQLCVDEVLERPA